MEEGTGNGDPHPISVGANYSRPFRHDADGDGISEFYVVGKRGEICQLPADMLRSKVQEWNTHDALSQNAAKCDEIPENEFTVVDLPKGSNFNYHYTSPLTEFMASREFAQHPNNPHPGDVVHSYTNTTREQGKFAAYEAGVLHYVNHVGIWKDDIDGDGQKNELEVFFYVMSPPVRLRRRKRSLTTFKGLYRVVYDLRDSRSEEQIEGGIESFEAWRLMRDTDGQVIFEEVVSAELGLGPLGDSFVSTFRDGRKYIFFSTGPEGSVYGAELIYNNVSSLI